MKNDMFMLSEECKNPQINEIAIRLLEHIIKTNSIITYGDLCKKLSFEMSPRIIEKPLGVISFVCMENGLPPISVMVINEYYNLPGKGFFKAYLPNVKDETEQLKKCVNWMNEVMDYKDWNKVLEAFKHETGKAA